MTNMTKAGLELVMQLWDHETGERIEIGEDRDGLGLMEIRYVGDDGKVGADIRFQPERTPQIIEALKRVAAFIIEQQAKERHHEHIRKETEGGT